MKLNLSKVTTSYKKPSPVLDYFLTLDIETSDNRTKDTTPSLCWSYQQGLCAYDYKNDELLDYEETRNILDLCNNLLEISKDVNTYNQDALIYCFIHNMPFDFSYLRAPLVDLFKLYYKDNLYFNEVFLSSGRYLFIRLNNIEFRCSYNLYNSSLYEFTKDMAVEHRKLIGENDYGTHYSDEQLPQNFSDYQKNDCIGLAEAITKLGKQEGYKLALLPYTYTSFNRKAMAKIFRKTYNGQHVNINEIRTFESCRPSVKEYNLLIDAYHGAFTMAMPDYVGEDIVDDIEGDDFRSMYPACMLFFDYPCTNGKMIVLKGMNKYERFCKLIEASNKAALMRITFKRPRLKKYKPIPFLKLNYLPETYGIPKDKAKLYNGRVISIDSDEYVDATVVSPDARIILSQYEFDDIDLVELYEYETAPLSPIITNKALTLFKEKTKAKIAYKQADALHKVDAWNKLVQAKIKLNNLAGILQEKPIRNSYHMTDEGKLVKEYNNLALLLNTETAYSTTRDALLKHYDGYKTGKCFSFTNGVFMLAYARELLFKAFNAIGQKNVIYADTDSAYYLKSSASIQALNIFNNKIEELARSRGAFCTIDGINYYMGIFDVDHENITRFKALAAKRYIFTDNEDISAALSGISGGVGLHEEYDEYGVPNQVYTYTREMELCGIPYETPRKPTLDDINKAFENFSSGFTFKICGGSTSVHLYNKPDVVNVNGHTELVAGGICLVPAERTLYNANDFLNSKEDMQVKLWSLDTLLGVKPRT